MSELVTTRIRATAGRLGLPHLAEALAGHVERADTAKMGYLDFLDLILEEELAVREERRLHYALRASKMPHHKTIDDYDFSYQPELDHRKVRDLATLAFVEGKANAALLGPPGVGKTHLAVALAVAACRAGYSVYFTTLGDMVRQLKAADAIGRLASKLRTYLRPHVLVLDELGLPAPGPRRGQPRLPDDLKTVREGRHRADVQQGLQQWITLMSDTLLAQSAIDRLTSACHELIVEGESYRRRQRPARTRIDQTRSDPPR